MTLGTDGGMTDVARFPPLPAIPTPPVDVPDERQQIFRRIAGGLTGQLLEGHGQVSVANTTQGYRASAVDLGALQKMLGRAIAHFDMTQVRERWDDDLFAWMRSGTFAWVQRCKMLRMTVKENGIRVVLETQDDCGYYQYEFDVFPGRNR
jgi:hypothetical protein